MTITFNQVTDKGFARLVEQTWDPVVAAHLHFTDGFTLAGYDVDRPVGILAVQWRALPQPLSATQEAFIDVIEVRLEHRRQGVGRHLVELAVAEAKRQGAYQVRAWSSEDKREAIAMWQSLEFALCPATTHPRGEEVKGYYVAKVTR